jgi:hypothetical protein
LLQQEFTCVGSVLDPRAYDVPPKVAVVRPVARQASPATVLLIRRTDTFPPRETVGSLPALMLGTSYKFGRGTLYQRVEY